MSQIDIRIALWNANGLQNHKDELQLFIRNNNIDILLVSETHFTERSHFNLRGFDVIRCDRPNGTPRGGSAIIIKSSINYEEQLHYCTEGVQATIIRINCGNRSINVCAVYCRPRDQLKERDYENLLKSMGNAFIAGGDYNAKHTWWGARICTTKGRELYKCIQKNNYSVLSTGSPTYWPARLNTLPDLLDFFIYSRIRTDLLSIVPSYDLSSDHSPIIATLKTRVNLKFHHPKLNYYKFKKVVECKTPSESEIKINSGPELNTYSNLLNDIITSSVKESEITNKTTNPNIISTVIRDKIREKRRLKAIYQRTLHRDDKTNFNRASKKLKELLHKYEQERICDFITELGPNEDGEKSLWNLTRSIKRPKARNPPISLQNSWLKSDKDKSEAFADHLEQQFSPFPGPNGDEIERQVDATIPMDLPIRPFTITELNEEIKYLNNKKAPGFDNITSRMIKCLPDKTKFMILVIFNAILLIGEFPSIWKQSVIIMIPKPGKPDHLINSYRPISLIPTFSKLFEKLFKSRLVSIVSIPNHQFGFRSGHSTIEQCHRFAHYIQSALQEKKYCCCVIIDIMQAFDRVWHAGLLYKIRNSMPGPTFKIIKSYLSNRSFYVRYGQEKSAVKPIRAGVPQGSVLGPLLYTLYTADMDIDENGLTGTYADDTGFLCSNKSQEQAQRMLQGKLDKFEDWANQWRIQVSPEKSKSIIFTLRQKEQLSPLTLYGQPIPEFESIKYLGLHLDQKLNFKTHILKKKEQLNIIIGKYGWLVGRRSPLAIENKLLLYKSLIRPVWSYCCPIWSAASNSNIKKIQVIQNKFLRNAINAPWYITNDVLHNDLKMEKVKEFVNINLSRYRNRIGEHPNELVTNMLDQPINRRLKRRVILDTLE